jgi:all-trans-retinol 13,14-reductase
MGENSKRVPGQLYILISFTPWIIYWVLTGFVGGFGVVLVFTSSFAIIFIGLFSLEESLV